MCRLCIDAHAYRQPNTQALKVLFCSVYGKETYQKTSTIKSFPLSEL